MQAGCDVGRCLGGSTDKHQVRNSNWKLRLNPNPTHLHLFLLDPALRPEEAMVLEVLRADESLQIDEILELLETQLTSSEVFTALFELEITGRIRQLPGKNYVRTL